MPTERSAGVVIFRKEKEVLCYLLLHYEAGHWDFPKGHIEEGEGLKEAAMREAEEETGIKDIEFVSGFEENIEYFFKTKEGTVFKTVVFFLAETKTKEIKLSSEHIGFEWLTYDQAMDRLTFESAENILKKANELIVK